MENTEAQETAASQEDEIVVNDFKVRKMATLGRPFMGLLMAAGGFLLTILATGTVASAQERFSDLVGKVSVGPVSKAGTIQVPYITWGGDVATFLSNGDLKTKPGSTYQQLGIDMQLVSGDDFVGQVKNYMSGKSPFLRGTMHMLGLASEVTGSDPRTKPVIVLQLSWSGGDHVVARKAIKSLNELKGKKIAVQQGGPHVGLLYDSLSAAQIKREDVEIIWVKDITGKDGPAEKFRQDTTIDACCVITPDMAGLTSGLNATGTGAEGTVEGAHVVNSTQQMSRSIADVIAVRSDWYDANKDWVRKYTAGYLKGTTQLVALRKSFEESKKLSPEYKSILQMSQKTFGVEFLPTLDLDAHGLLLDCNFVGLPGQIAFFKDSGNLSGFAAKTKEALDLAQSWGYARERFGFEPNDFDYKGIAKLAGIEYVEPKQVDRFSQAESTDMFQTDALDENTIVSFTISFEPNQQDFSTDRYGAEFARALKAASTFGNARVIVRGHSDPTKTLSDFVASGLSKNILQRNGTQGNYRYFYQGKPLDMNNIKAITDLIRQGVFGGGQNDPTVTMQAALNLSKARADAVRDALIAYAKQTGSNLDLSQISPVGAGIMEPVIAKPRTIEEAKENMRVEFRIVKVDAEALAPSDFSF